MWSYVASAASAVLSKAQGIPGLPAYQLGEVDERYSSPVWTLYRASKRDDSTPVSIFVCDSSSSKIPSALSFARNSLRKLRSLRHPDILRFLDGTDQDGAVYIVTEAIDPFHSRVSSGSMASQASSSDVESKIWGLSHIATALSFIHETGLATHGHLQPDAVFVTSAGEWKLGGFELLSSPKDDNPILYSDANLLRSFVSPPELSDARLSSLRDLPLSSLDSYQLAVFISTVFNGKPDIRRPVQGSIPRSIFLTLPRLSASEPHSRLSCKAFCDLGFSASGFNTEKSSGFFSSNRLIKLSKALESFALASESERSDIVEQIKSSVDTSSSTKLPTAFLNHKVLPLMVKALEFGPGGSSLMALILSLGQSLNPKEFDSAILQPLIRMYTSSDRAMRLALLENLPSYVEKLENKIVVDKIWPNLITGFTDVVPVIREATVRSIPLIAPKLSDRILNNDLLRYLSKTQTDNEPGIRTNTCILLARLSKHLNITTNRKVLVPAFARSLRDPFVHARMAGLNAYMATVDCFERDDIAARIIPALSLRLTDKEKIVRDQSFKAIDLFLKKIQQLVADMPETALPVDQQKKNTAGVAESATSAAAALSGWAVTSLNSKLSVDSNSSSNNNNNKQMERSTSTPPSIRPSVSPSNSNGISLPPPPSQQNRTASGSANIGTLQPPISAVPARLDSSARSTSQLSLPELGSQNGNSTSNNNNSNNDMDLMSGDAGDWGNDLMDFAIKEDLDDWAPMEVSAGRAGAGGMQPPLLPDSAPTSTTSSTFPTSNNKGTSSLKLDNSKGKQAAMLSVLENETMKPSWNNTNDDESKWKSLASAPALKPTPAPTISPKINTSNLNNSSSNNDDGWGNFEDDDGWGSNNKLNSPKSFTATSKAEKAAQMAKAKEERKQRLAQLREQKQAHASSR